MRRSAGGAVSKWPWHKGEERFTFVNIGYGYAVARGRDQEGVDCWGADLGEC